jgi:hypothetical protein
LEVFSLFVVKLRMLPKKKKHGLNQLRQRIKISSSERVESSGRTYQKGAQDEAQVASSVSTDEQAVVRHWIQTPTKKRQREASASPPVLFLPRSTRDKARWEREGKREERKRLLTSDVEREIRKLVDPPDLVEDVEHVASDDVEELIAHVIELEALEVKVGDAFAPIWFVSKTNRKGGGRRGRGTSRSVIVQARNKEAAVSRGKKEERKE